MLAFYTLKNGTIYAPLGTPMSLSSACSRLNEMLINEHYTDRKIRHGCTDTCCDQCDDYYEAQVKQQQESENKTT